MDEEKRRLLFTLLKDQLTDAAELAVFKFLHSGGSTYATREGFDRFYRQLAAQGVPDPAAHVREAAVNLQKILDDPDSLDAVARFSADNTKNPALVRAIDVAAAEAGVPAEKVNEMWAEAFATDTEKLDPRLSDDERLFVKSTVEIVRYGAEKGYYTSSVADAPLDSKWALAVKREFAKRGKAAGKE